MHCVFLTLSYLTSVKFLFELLNCFIEQVIFFYLFYTNHYVYRINDRTWQYDCYKFSPYWCGCWRRCCPPPLVPGPTFQNQSPVNPPPPAWLPEWAIKEGLYTTWLVIHHEGVAYQSRPDERSRTASGRGPTAGMELQGTVTRGVESPRWYLKIYGFEDST